MKKVWTAPPVFVVCKKGLMCQPVTVTAAGCYAAFPTIGSGKTYSSANATPIK